MKQTLLTGAKASSLAALIPMVMGVVPQEWDHLICTLIIVCGAMITVIPAPHAGSVWMGFYKVLSVVGLNFGWAANHLAAGVSSAGRPDVAEDAAQARAEVNRKTP